jgi:GntR family transcriptional regulator
MGAARDPQRPSGTLLGTIDRRMLQAAEGTTMAPSLASHRTRPATERVRDHLLTALHLGKLNPGDRVVSVRQLAQVTGINRKTVHRAYRQLAREGLLEPRPGAGTFVADSSMPRGVPGGGQVLLDAVARCTREASALGLEPLVFADLLRNYVGDGLRDLPIGVVECNGEQIGLIAAELERTLRVVARPIALETLRREGAAAASAVFALVTTDCHRLEVQSAIDSAATPVHPVALDPTFPESVLDTLRRSALVMVVGDLAFSGVFRKLLLQTGAPPDLLERLQVVEPRAARRAVRAGGPGTTLWVSPLVERELDHALASEVPRLQQQWRILPASIDRVRAGLACNLALAKGVGH